MSRDGYLPRALRVIRALLLVLLLTPPVAAADQRQQGPDLQDRYLEVLHHLCDQLVSTQVTDPGDPDYGALVSPSTNPQPNPRHSRAAEAVYPLAVLYRHSGDPRYRDSAVILGNWLVGLQQDDGAWGENWPGHDGWNGTTADQLISLAGALELLGPELGAEDHRAWSQAIAAAADFSLDRFGPGRSNINYIPTAAVGLVLAHRAVAAPNDEWLEKAAELMSYLATQVNEDGLIVGEGKGVDLGYNIAQTIGFMAWYGILRNETATVERAASLLKPHLNFMYPNGAIDNSWGTRSFKWTLESGTKTAPGVHFTFALLADRDPAFRRGARLALDWLEYHALDDHDRVVYGPHADQHPNSTPPSNYGTFARAQSIATAIEYGPSAGESAPIPAEFTNWVRHFPSVDTAVLRTERVMATLSAYANNRRYPLETAVRGGSATLVWYEGYGQDGFLQASSQTVYNRIESRHMPDGIDPLPLTPRIESAGPPYRSNLFDAGARLEVSESGEAINVVTSGTLRTIEEEAGPAFTWKHEFFADGYRKTVVLDRREGLRIVEPFVDNPGNRYALDGADTFVITQADGRKWQLRVDSSSAPYTLSHGEDRARYYHPFPGMNAYPLHLSFDGKGPATVSYTVTRRAEDTAAVLNAFDSYLESTAKQLGDAPFAAVVSRNGEILYERYDDGGGVLGKTVNAQSRWQLFSITKSFVAALVLKLSQDGVISLDDPAGAYLPAFKQRGTGAFDRRSVTLRHLMSHTSGVALHGNKNPESLPPNLGEIEVVTEPGADFTYSRLGMFVLERALEAATGKDLDALLKEQILVPLGLGSVGYVYDAPPAGNVLPLNTGRYRLSEKGKRAGSGLFATARDLNAFGQFWLDPVPMFGPELRAEAWQWHGTRSSDRGHYGLMWWLFEEDGGYVMSGFQSKINAVVPETGAVLTVIRYPQDKPSEEYRFVDDKRALVRFGKRL